MTELSLTTPALLFPTISLLLIAYTNRYIAISNRIRLLHTMYKTDKSSGILEQIRILRRRILLIRNMQQFGIVGMFTAALTMFLIYYDLRVWAHLVFSISLLSLLISISLTSVEIYLSHKALMIQLSDMEELVGRRRRE